jgi:hypothetical protein
MSGPLALVGGAEFQPGNESQDRMLAAAAAGRPAYVVCRRAAFASGEAILGIPTPAATASG